MKISKSLSLKVNLGNYQVADFFVSAEEEVEKDVLEIAAEGLHNWLKKELTKDVNNSKKYLQDLANAPAVPLAPKVPIVRDAGRKVAISKEVGNIDDEIDQGLMDKLSTNENPFTGYKIN